MPIELNVNIEEFARAARDNKPPTGLGDIVYGWDDNDSSVLVIGAHQGFDDTFDPNTGIRLKHCHKILVMSWTERKTMTFDNAITVPADLRARVITPDGTGRLHSVTGDGVRVRLDGGLVGLYTDQDSVQLFSWDRYQCH
ncbi:hypothetical protein [Fibrobacter sp.]|uniref:hypothetical protein n=1 Tax=Fibrobacter sp. TaxID=35828 RepID=UPI00388FA8D9